MASKSPYESLPPSSFWRTGVADQHPLTAKGLYTKKFAIEPTDLIATAGSCFAQHIAKKLTQNGFSVIQNEPSPPHLSEANAQKFGYGIFSARFGNIYVVRQLLQLLQEALGKRTPTAEEIVWENDGRFYDALRPSVEPTGLESPALVMTHRESHIKHVRRMFRKMNVFVFTLGLTECWVNKATGTVYPTCPGTIAGQFDPEKYEFKNLTFEETYNDFLRFRNLIKLQNPTARFILTVSPVPLTATASGTHVLSATTYSKSVLRAVAGQLYAEFEDVEYFPSYEIISSPWSRGYFYEPNLRSINPGGVDVVMNTFFSQHHGPAPKTPAGSTGKDAETDPFCEDALLEAFTSK